MPNMPRYSVLLLFFATEASFGWPVFDAANFAQNMATAGHTLKAYYKDVELAYNSVQQIKHQVEMLKGLDIKRISDIKNQLENIQALATEGQALTYASDNISERFAENFGSSDKENPNFADRFNKQNKIVLDTTQSTLKTAQQHMEYNRKEAEGVEQISNASNDAEGIRGAIQGTNQLLDANAAQLQRIAEMQAQKNSQDATIEAARIAQLQDQAEQNEQFLNYKIDYQGYKNNDALAKIPTFKTM